MVERRSREVVFRIRWPLRVQDFPSGGFRIFLPWWGRPYRAIARLFGLQLLTLHFAFPPIWPRYSARVDYSGLTID